MAFNLVLMRQGDPPDGRMEPANLDWWDDDKFVGDKDFDAWHRNGAEGEPSRAIYTSFMGDWYWRPSDFDQTFHALMLGPISATSRLIRLCDELERDHSLWLYASV